MKLKQQSSGSHQSRLLQGQIQTGIEEKNKTEKEKEREIGMRHIHSINKPQTTIQNFNFNLTGINKSD